MTPQPQPEEMTPTRGSKRYREQAEGNTDKDYAAAVAASPLKRPALTKTVGKRGLIDTHEYLRLLQQSMASLGYGSIAAELSSRSGVPTTSAAATELQQRVMSGDWDGAARCVPTLAVPTAQAESACLGLLTEQKFRELLLRGDVLAAIKCLRTELAPLVVSVDRLRSLSRLLVSRNEEETSSDIGGGGSSSGGGGGGDFLPTAATEARRRVLQAMQAILPPGTLIFDGRLEALIEQALASQMDRCTFHNVPTPQLSLLSDYCAGREQLPTNLSQTLRAHSDEIWDLSFSHKGDLLASAGKDARVVLWELERREGEEEGEGGGEETERFVLRRVLSGHGGPVAALAWSPDDSMLASCGQDRKVRVWSTLAGTGSGCLRVLHEHSDTVVSIAWLPDGETLLTASQDRSVVVIGIDGRVRQRWLVRDLKDAKVTPNGKHILVSRYEDGGLAVFTLSPQGSFERGTDILLTHASSGVTSFSISSCGHYLLANIGEDGAPIGLWKLEEREKEEGCLELRASHIAIRKFCFPPEREFEDSSDLFRSCLGGVGERFIASGAASGSVSLWHRASGELLATMESHTGPVNAVSWSSSMPGVLATASDDGTVKIWRNGSAAADDDSEAMAE